MQIMNLPISQLQQKIPQYDLSFHGYETLKKQKKKQNKKITITAIGKLK